MATGDDSHADALKAMRARWRRPLSGMGWYRDTTRAFAALPDVGPPALSAQRPGAAGRSRTTVAEASMTSVG